MDEAEFAFQNGFTLSIVTDSFSRAHLEIKGLTHIELLIKTLLKLIFPFCHENSCKQKGKYLSKKICSYYIRKKNDVRIVIRPKRGASQGPNIAIVNPLY